MEGAQPVLDVGPEGVTFGRDPSNRVVLPRHLYPGVSAHHALVGDRDGRLVLEDLHSKNRTLVFGRPVDRHELRHGDVFQLGPSGPRFAALSSRGEADETLIVQARSRSGDLRSLGAETLLLVRRKLGLPDGTDLAALTRPRPRRVGWLLAGLTLCILLGGGVVAFVSLQEQGRAAVASIEARTLELQRSLERSLAVARAELAAQEEATRQQAERLTAWEAEKVRIEEHRARLIAELDLLRASREASAEEIAALRAEVDHATRAAERYNPVKLEEERLAVVGRIEPAVVLVEATRSYRRAADGAPLFMESADNGAFRLNYEGAGEPFRSQATGSGFCVDASGRIITNAHVVFRKGEDARPITLPDGTARPSLELAVVFSGTARRHPARLVRYAAGGDDDLALLAIDPFPGMPHLGDALDLAADVPPRGSDVFLIGFPLGKKALQQGDTMIASTFRGIVSRQVRHFIQVDAAVHPGASGGPVIDARGRLLGVVTGMQPVDEDASSSAIGYIIPIAMAHAVLDG